MALDSGRIGAVVELECRDPAVGIALEKLRRPRLALVDVHVGPLVFLAELRQQQTHLVAVARVEIVVEVHGAFPFVWPKSIPPMHSARDSQGFSLRLSYSCPGHGTTTSTPERTARLRSFGAARQLRGRRIRAARVGRGRQPAGAPPRAISRHPAVSATGARPHAHRPGPGLSTRALGRVRSAGRVHRARAHQARRRRAHPHHARRLRQWLAAAAHASLSGARAARGRGAANLAAGPGFQA